MAYDLDHYISRLKTANIGFEKGIGEYKGDYYDVGEKWEVQYRNNSVRLMT